MGSTEPAHRFNIIIVGAGIAGLTAAIGLHQKGHEVTVLERHADTQALGGPINISPSGTKILTQYGLKDRIFEQLCPEKQPTYFRRFNDGKKLRTIAAGESEKMFGSL